GKHEEGRQSENQVWSWQDDEGVTLIRKGFSSKVGPANLVAAITQLMTDGMSIGEGTKGVYHINGELNVAADRLSRDSEYHPGGLIQEYVSPEELQSTIESQR
ncbi:hypothetical protein FOZ60_015159, partial [Perkinsus olseni]